MPEVRIFKVFKGMPKYKETIELEGVEGLKSIKADKFPHTEKGLVVIALVRLEPRFYGEFRIRIPDTSKDYWEAGVASQEDKFTWLDMKYGEVDVTFPRPGKYIVDISLNDVPIHVTSLLVEQA